jgi:hypothetical protein
VETELRRGYLGTARRKGRQQTNQTYGHRATSRLYRSETVARRLAANAYSTPEWTAANDCSSACQLEPENTYCEIIPMVLSHFSTNRGHPDTGSFDGVRPNA